MLSTIQSIDISVSDLLEPMIIIHYPPNILSGTKQNQNGRSNPQDVDWADIMNSARDDIGSDKRETSSGG